MPTITIALTPTFTHLEAQPFERVPGASGQVPQTVSLTAGAGSIVVAATGSNWCWRFTEHGPGVKRSRFCAVTGDAAYASLADFDPGTLTAAVTPSTPAWEAIANAAASSASAASAAANAAAPKTARYLFGVNGALGNEAPAMQAVIDAASADEIVRFYGTFATTSTVTFKGNVDASGALVRYTGTGIATQVGLTGSVTSRKTIVMPRVEAASKSGTGWASVAGSIGVLIVNMQSCPMIVIPHVKNFETGLAVRGANAGNVYNNILVGHLDNNKVNHSVDATGTGWSNQNTYVGGRFGHNSNEGTNVPGVRHVQCTTGLGNPINNNKWINSSLEGDIPEYTIEGAGTNNVFDNCRYEVTGGARVWWRADATDNDIAGGYKSDAIIYTREAGSTRNGLASSKLWIRAFSGSTAFLTENSTTSANPVFNIMEAGGISAGADPTTAYAVRIGAQTCSFKRAADSFDRVQIDAVNSRIYLGSGAAALARYFANVGTSAISMNGGNFVPGVTNTLDLGTTGLQWRYIRAGTAVQTGAAATGSRPSATTAGVGAMFFDTTLNKPIWSDGTAWRDATGTTV